MERRMPDHPDVAAALETGLPMGAERENRDSAENRRAFAEEHIRAFLDFALAGNEDLLEDFVDHYRWKYLNWLN